MISSTFRSPIIAMILEKAPKIYNWGIKAIKIHITMIRLIIGSALYSRGIGEFGVKVCLKKNLMGAINPGLDKGGPTLCWILAWMNFLSIPGSQILTANAMINVPITPKIVIIMVVSILTLPMVLNIYG
jgi:hypothetical protein